MPTRSARTSTSGKTWLDSNTVAPPSRTSRTRSLNACWSRGSSPGAGLVEQEQLRPAHERLHQTHLAAVAGAQLASRAGGIELEALEELANPGSVPPAPEVVEELDQVGGAVGPAPLGDIRAPVGRVGDCAS